MRVEMRVLLMLVTITFGAILGTVSTAQAKSCYSPAEAEAEYAIRIHSELMVLSLIHI